MNDNSPFVDTNLLPTKTYESGINQILQNRKKIINLKTRSSLILARFFLKIFEPIIKKKCSNTELKNLNLDVHNFFGLGKLAFNSEFSIKIKKNKFYNKIFSFHTSDEGQSVNKSIYAKKVVLVIW